VEARDAGANPGSYVRALAALGFEDDLSKLAADKKVGRKLQDLALQPEPTTMRRLRSTGKR
jgi:hypothetical protein